MATVKTNAWSGEAQVGLDVLFGAKDREMVYGRFKLAYQRPYDSNPKKYFRNVFDYSIEYGRTETRYTREGEPGEPPVSYTRMEPSSDRMSASAKAFSASFQSVASTCQVYERIVTRVLRRRSTRTGSAR